MIRCIFLLLVCSVYCTAQIDFIEHLPDTVFVESSKDVAEGKSFCEGKGKSCIVVSRGCREQAFPIDEMWVQKNLKINFYHVCMALCLYKIALKFMASGLQPARVMNRQGARLLCCMVFWLVALVQHWAWAYFPSTTNTLEQKLSGGLLVDSFLLQA